MHYGELMAENPKWTPQQAIFIYHLQNNPSGAEQIYGALDDNHGGMCALGLGMEAFGIIRNWEQYKAKFPDAKVGDFESSDGYNPYKLIAEILDISTQDVSEIYNLNDNEQLSFEDIAKIFGDWLNSERSMSIDKFHEWQQDEPFRVFEQDWNAMQATVKGLLETLTSTHNLTSYGGKGITLDEVYEDAADIWEDYGN